ncbi:MAG TPA: sugar phosphate isomerase/epimerase family protein [Acidisarcina sp.]
MQYASFGIRARAMLRVISTHVFLRQRLHPGLLDILARGAAEGVEIFAARQHFDYTDRAHIREIANWFAANPVQPFSMHSPLYPDKEMGRGGAPSLNVVHPDKSHRIDAMDEIKRALEVAEQIHFKYLIVHLGDREDTWTLRTLEHSMTALEHLRAFASPLGVKLLIENLNSDVAQPSHLTEIIATGHFHDIGVCLDVGHAHLRDGIPSAITELKDHLRSSHLHDNEGDKDAHLWPGDGTIAWPETMTELKAAPKGPAAVLEIHYALEDQPEAVANKARKAFQLLGLLDVENEPNQ